MDYYSKLKRGGISTGNIDNQDSIAMIYALEILRNDLKFNQYFSDNNEWRIAFEGNDDIEILNNDFCIFIQVKTSKLTLTDLNAILNNFLINYEKYINYYNEQAFMISGLHGVSDSLKSFPKKLNEYRNSKITYKKEIYSEHLTKLMNEYNLNEKFKIILDNLLIDERYLIKDNSDTLAVFAHNLRQTYFIRDIGDRLVSNIYKEFNLRFSEYRRNRNSISKMEILDIINGELRKVELISNLEVVSGYQKTDSGYNRIKDNEYIFKLQNCQDKMERYVFRNWRKAYFKEFILSLLFGATKCPECNHPMMANLLGLNGISCPKCGYHPYLTLFFSCYCGDCIAIKTQPNLVTEDIFNYLYEFFDEEDKCSKCGEKYIDNYIIERTTLMPVPFPFSEFNLKELYFKNRKKY